MKLRKDRICVYKYSGFKERLAYFAAYKSRVAFYAVPHNIPVAIDKKLENYKAAKATLQFPIDTEVPIDLLGKRVILRKTEIEG